MYRLFNVIHLATGRHMKYTFNLVKGFHWSVHQCIRCLDIDFLKKNINVSLLSKLNTAPRNKARIKSRLNKSCIAVYRSTISEVFNFAQCQLKKFFFSNIKIDRLKKNIEITMQIPVW